MVQKPVPRAAHCPLFPWDSPEYPPGLAATGVTSLGYSLTYSPTAQQPSNILMVHPAREDIKICDFGFAQHITLGEPQYSKYGSPEFVSPEVIEQMPVSEASDIW